jgi:EmrB/QacA subfamily drug resistance transporter
MSFATVTGGDRRRWIALMVVCLAMLMNTLDVSIVNVALPAIQRSLHFTQANLTWVIDAYLITFGSFLLLAGRLGDLVGRKRVFLAGIALFTLASALCGLSDSQGLLIGARFVQGIGGAVSSSVIIAIIVTEFPEARERAKAMSAYIFVAVGGGSIGLLVGGLLTQTAGWHWIFFINVPIGIVTLLLGSALIAENEGLGVGKGVDILGSALVTGSLMLIIYAIIKSTNYGWGSAHTLGFGGLGILLLIAFVALESRITNPIMPLRIFRLRTLSGSSALRGILASGMFTTFFLGALYLERVRGYGPLSTGIAFMPFSLIVAICSSGVTARLVGRFGARAVLMPGIVASVAGLLLLSRVGPHTDYFPLLALAFTVAGFGMGNSFMPLLTIAMADVPRSDAGLASGIVNVSMQVSAALGLAVYGAIATAHTTSLLAAHEPLTTALTGGYRLAFEVAAACVAVGGLLAPLLLRAPRGSKLPAAEQTAPPQAAPAPARAAR